ncbi:hypothetical protein [Rufibacter ruber]|uniref:hypothetical protein n=1 Tax=Rufibacter ruber TaxID=1783499 RepID=UPI000836CDF8|nr:hypothetical protein [Rufibacter ruber]
MERKLFRIFLSFFPWRKRLLVFLEKGSFCSRAVFVKLGLKRRHQHRQHRLRSQDTLNAKKQKIQRSFYDREQYLIMAWNYERESIRKDADSVSGLFYRNSEKQKPTKVE